MQICEIDTDANKVVCCRQNLSQIEENLISASDEWHAQQQKRGKGLYPTLDTEKPGCDFSASAADNSLKVAVIAVMGMYRTGKSFMLDLLMRYLMSEEGQAHLNEPEGKVWRVADNKTYSTTKKV